MHFKNIQKNLLTAAILVGLIFSPAMANKPSQGPRSPSLSPRKEKPAMAVEVKNKNKSGSESKLEKLCFEEIIGKQFSLHESMQVQDVYKLLCQAEFGAAHIIHDVESARKYFEQEYDKTKPNEKEELLEQISPDGNIYRINFGAYKARFSDKVKNKDKEALFKIFIESSEKMKGSGSLQGLLEKWQEFKDINSQKNYFSKEQIMRFEDFIVMNGFPFVSHSPPYKAKNKPAYRVVHIDIVKKYLLHIFSDSTKGTSSGTGSYDVHSSDPTAHPNK